MRLELETPVSFQDEIVPKGAQLAGWAALVHALGLQAPVRQPSCVSEKHIGGSQREEGGFRVFDKRYQPGDDVADQLTFALRHENIDLLILKRAFEAVPKAVLEDYVRSTPTGTHTRRAWFFYEMLTGQTLDLDDAPNATAVDALDTKAYFTGKAKLSRRHKVRDNLLGSGDWCPVIRRTEQLEAFAALGLAERAAETVGRTGQHLVTRAASFLLLADSRASFEIEGERAPRNRLERWGRAVLQAGKNELTLDEVIRLHSVLIEDKRFIFPGLRPDGVFLGERDHLGDPLPEFIGARPQDLEVLSAGMLAANNRMRDDGLDPILQAAATAFGFIYVHPFQDGNGRVHRCLIHHVLAERKYTPPGMVFPVSSVMLDRIDDYRRTLQAHSTPLMDCIEWRPTAERNVEVLNDTVDLYRYFDCTEASEFLYACVQRTVEHDLPKEIDYLRRHDEAMARIMEMIEMPDRLAQNLILFIRQNDGALSKRKREKEFSALTDEEVQGLENIVQDAFDGFDETVTKG
ncbi:MAG: cell filamentation protein Fic [Proteobacteria bacterium]|nr:MAG: cell filamentation protein Fic [Pseudomonadota bacterium]QKK10362.1 MAG: cell filamentation protein Fic [Pseudomonadota bacterium]